MSKRALPVPLDESGEAYRILFNPVVFRISHFLIKHMVQIYFRAQMFGEENYPDGQYIGVFNHSSNLDLVALSLAVDTVTPAWAKDSLFRIPVFSWWARRVSFVPVRRGEKDEIAYTTARRLIDQGYNFYVAPEGTRRRTPEDRPRPRTGVIRLAHETGLPVVPIGLSGGFDALPPGKSFPRPRKLVVRAGKPVQLEPLDITPENYGKMQDQARHVMERVYELVED